MPPGLPTLREISGTELGEFSHYPIYLTLRCTDIGIGIEERSNIGSGTVP
jgi:hypothetical protein